MSKKIEILELASDVVAAYVSHNDMDADELPNLVQSVYRAMQQSLSTEEKVEQEPLTPAVPIDTSVSDDYIVCLEDGQRYKSLKRHLRTKYAMTPKQYREKWGLPADYPMVAPNYSIERSRLAKRTGLGKS